MIIKILRSFSSLWTEADKKEDEKDGEDKYQPRSIRDRRRPREKRRSTGVSFWTQDVRDFLSVTSRTPPSRDLTWFFCVFQGDENDPDQQSDSEDSSLKGELQVKSRKWFLFYQNLCFSMIVAMETLNKKHIVFQNLFGDI